MYFGRKFNKKRNNFTVRIEKQHELCYNIIKLNTRYDNFVLTRYIDL